MPLFMNLHDLSPWGLREGDLHLLTKYGFKKKDFMNLHNDLRRGAFPPTRNQVREILEIPENRDFLPFETNDPEALTIGIDAISQGKVAACILNGGMATRFGGVVKGVVEVWRGLSFLGLRLRDIARLQRPVPVFLMNSFATQDATREHLEKNNYFGLQPTSVHLLTQRIAPRLTPDGQLFLDSQGAPSFYAPGHGDLFEVLAESPDYQTFVARGGQQVFVSNVDNVGATLNPTVLGAHLRTKQPVTVEVAQRDPGDKGGAPVRRNQRIEVLEGFRFPESFDITAIPVFNTNTMWITTASILADYPLTWFRVDKEVQGRPAVQFERLMGEVTSFVNSAYLKVPREGVQTRFLPVKTPQDLAAVQSLVAKLFADYL